MTEQPKNACNSMSENSTINKDGKKKRFNENPLARLPNGHLPPDIRLMTLLFDGTRPLDNEESLQNALENLASAKRACEIWLEYNNTIDNLFKISDLIISFQMELNCIELLEGIYAKRLDYVDNTPGSRQKCDTLCSSGGT